jgi:CelD/BcsL family acetyltransferase involved in cellulose biosynthesis
MSLRAEAVTDLARLQELREPWDELAVATGRPFCAPGWLLPWWEEAAPPGARLHSVAVFDDDRLVALAPFHLDGDHLLPLGFGAVTRVEPVAAPGREREAAAALAPCLPRAALLRLRGIPVASPWPELLAQSWPAWLHEDERMPAPATELDGVTFEEWLSGRSASFRKQLRRFQRRLEERGARIELVEDRDALPGALRAFAALHHSRWNSRGGSGVLNPHVEAAVARSAEELPGDRFRVFLIQGPDGPVAADVVVAAGGEAGQWLGGHDDDWGDISPLLLLGVAGIEQAIRSGDRRFDLGAGWAQEKERLANTTETLRWVTLVPRGPGHLRTRLQLLPGHMRRALSRRLSPEQKRLVKRLLRRSA